MINDLIGWAVTIVEAMHWLINQKPVFCGQTGLRECCE
jgi:hypothetical protein